MTTGPKLASERSRISSARAAHKAERFFAILGLFAALTYAATADAQAVSPTPRTPAPVAPPAATTPVTPAPSAPPTTSSSSTTTTTQKAWTPAISSPTTPSATTTTTETTTVKPAPIVDQPTTPSTTPAPVAAAPTPVAGPREQLETQRTEHKLEVKEKLSDVDARMEHLDRQREERGRIAGPISMLTTGYTVGLAALAVSIGAFVAAEQVKDSKGFKNRLDINNDNELNGSDENSFRNISRTMGALSAVGFGVGIAGSLFLAKRLKERRQLDPDVRKLQNERRELRRELNYSANASGTGLSFGLSGRF